VPDSLDDLLRERALLLERLQELNRQIAEFEGTAAEPMGDAPPFLGQIRADVRDAEAMLEEYRQEALSGATRAKRGCLFIFTVAIGLLLLGLGAMYLYLKARQAH
jgi:hypothetical protein